MLDILIEFAIFIVQTICILCCEAVQKFYQYLIANYKDISNDVILVTGAGGGIGRLLCLEFARYSSRILALDYNSVGLSETQKLVLTETGRQIKIYSCDLRSKKEIDATVAAILGENGRVDILINNAGIVNGENLLDLTQEQIENCFKVNVFSHFYLIQAFLPHMLRETDTYTNTTNTSKILKSYVRGHIVSVASLAGYVPGAGLSDYCASKAAAILLQESLELELLKKGIYDEICLTRVLPFLINTDMFKGCTTDKPWLFPIVDSVYCARRIVQAVRLNERTVYITARYRLFPLLKLLLPPKTIHHLYSYSRSGCFIDQLKAHRQKSL